MGSLSACFVLSFKVKPNIENSPWSSCLDILLKRWPFCLTVSWPLSLLMSGQVKNLACLQDTCVPSQISLAFLIRISGASHACQSVTEHVEVLVASTTHLEPVRTTIFWGRSLEGDRFEVLVGRRAVELEYIKSSSSIHVFVKLAGVLETWGLSSIMFFEFGR